MSAEENLQLIEDCEARESRLNDWERGFLDSIRRRIEAGDSLTEKQTDILNKTWEKATSKN